jgi:AcrR family transcriptional regulator
MPTKTSYTDHANAGRILQDSWELFQQKGYRGVSVDEICRRCELTKPTLYYYFQSKENLFVEVLLHRLHGFRQAIEQPGPIEARLERLAATMLDSFRSDYSLLVRDLEHIEAPENRQRVRKAFAAEISDPIAAVMREGIGSGQLVGDDPRFLAQVFMGMVQSFIARGSEFGLSNAGLARQVTAFFLKGAR